MNVKTATTKYKVIDLIKKRWSPRSFSDKTISEEDLNTLFEAASWAFSSSNVQPWHYIYAYREDKDAFAKLFDCLDEGNKVWVKNAVVLMAIFAHKKTKHGRENIVAQHDVGAANATLALQAISMDIYCHPMIGFDHEKASKTLNIDTEDMEPVAFMALGYLDVPEKLEEPNRTRESEPRTRKPISEFTSRLK